MFRLILVSALVLLMSACNNVSYVEIKDLPQKHWLKGQTVDFKFNQTDTESENTIFILVRHSKEYKYDKLYLEVKTTTPSNKYWCDSIAIKLADKEMKWFGRDMSTHYDLTSIFRKNTKFAEQGDYKINMRYYYPADSLEGIEALGMTIEKNGKK